MKFVYNRTWLHHLLLTKEAKRWQQHAWISKDQFKRIVLEYPSSFYHPNLFIRLLLFIATLIALSGMTGLLGLLFANAGEKALALLCILYGVGSWIFLENVFVKNTHHYKSGVTEALLYHSIAFVIGGVAWISGGNLTMVLLCSIGAFGFASIRFIDLVSTLCGLGCLAYLLFHSLYQAGGVIQNLIPFALIFFFSGFYLFIMRGKKKKWSEWEDCLIVVETFCLLIIYAGGNYLVVRELSVSLMGLQLQEGEDIPFAWLFYFLTMAIPLLYIYFGIKKKDIVMIRVSLVTILFAVVTFKYYFSLGHHEIALTISGIILIGGVLWLFRYLKTPRNGFTAENILSERWGNANLGAFIVSQTLGGNKTPERPEETGGSFGGGGSTDRF